MHADRSRTVDVSSVVVDEYRLFGAQPEPLEREVVDRRVGLHQFLFARHDDIAEPVEQCGFTCAERWPEFVAEICDREQRYAGRVELRHDLVHADDRRADAVDETWAPQRDQIGMLRIQGCELRRGFGEVAAGIVLEVPVGGDDIAQERIERPIVRDQALVEDPRIPVVQDATDVENDGGRREGVQPWRALKRRFVLLMT
jgi:hypothetical protein